MLFNLLTLVSPQSDPKVILRPSFELWPLETQDQTTTKLEVTTVTAGPDGREATQTFNTICKDTIEVTQAYLPAVTEGKEPNPQSLSFKLQALRRELEVRVGSSPKGRGIIIGTESGSFQTLKNKEFKLFLGNDLKVVDSQGIADLSNGIDLSQTDPAVKPFCEMLKEELTDQWFYSALGDSLTFIFSGKTISLASTWTEKIDDHSFRGVGSASSSLKITVETIREDHVRLSYEGIVDNLKIDKKALRLQSDLEVSPTPGKTEGTIVLAIVKSSDGKGSLFLRSMTSSSSFTLHMSRASSDPGIRTATYNYTIDRVVESRRQKQ